MQAIDQLREDTRQLLVRTQTMLIGSIIIAPIVFLVEFSPPLINMLQVGSGLQENYAGQVTSQYILALLRNLSTFPVAKTAIVFIIWAIVGLAAYFIVLSFIRVLLNVRNEIVIDARYAAKGSALRLMAMHFSQKIFAAVAFVAFVAFGFLLLIPYCMDLMRIFVYDMSWLNSVLLVIGLLGFTATIYALWAFAYLTWLYEEEV